jgi:glycerol-3-phosphate acyltransferase PlsY
MSLVWYFVLCTIGGYLLGSVPYGLVLTRLAGYGDIRKIGSGNIGTTNVLRTGNKMLALLTLLLDLFKGAVAAWLAAAWLNAAVVPMIELYLGGFSVTAAHLAALLAGTAAFFGHLFPVWLKFKGGKGVATACGLLLGINWHMAALAFGIWLIMAFTFRYSSLSALTAAAAAPFIAYFLCPPVDTVVVTILVLIIIYKHHANIYRLLHGQESKITFKKK